MSLPDEPTFSEPWQAQAFALAVHLRDRGLIEWSDFSQALGDQIAARADCYRAVDYYDCWVDALEEVLVTNGCADHNTLHALEHDWAEAYRRTPHGKPVTL